MLVSVFYNSFLRISYVYQRMGEFIRHQPDPIEIVETSLNNGELTATDRAVIAALRKVLILARRAQDQIDRLTVLSETDPLTGLYNRRAFLDRLTQAIQSLPFGNRATDPVGLIVMMIDSDKFKRVNDKYGHAAGDEVLVATAQILTNSVREGDVVGRLGGDEFGVFLLVDNPGADDSGVISDLDMVEAADATLKKVAQRLEDATRAHNSQEDNAGKHVRFSTGATAIFFGDDVTAEEAIAEADNLMYKKKRWR
jgi:diguanylate cyclase (GGDEF)-like protein